MVDHPARPPTSRVDLARAPTFQLGKLEIRPATREVVGAGQRQVLEPRVMQVLVAFFAAQGEVVTRSDLTERCWDGRIVGEDAINRIISRIHRLAELDGGNSFQLETLRGVDYRMTIAPQAGDDETTASPPVVGRRRWVWAAAAIAVAVLVVGGGLLIARQRPPAALPDSTPAESLTLAVLPFDDLTGAPARSSLAEGLSRDLRNRLSRLRGLRVLAETSSFAAASGGAAPVALGRRLNADFLLDGYAGRTRQ